MAFTYVTTTDRGKVRLLIADTVEATAIFTDADIDALLELSSQEVFLSATYALRAMANNAALRAKAIRAGAWSEDTRDAAKNMLALADSYETTAYETPADELVEMDWDQFAFVRREYNEEMREE